MKKAKLTIQVIKEDKGYSATCQSGDYFIATEGGSFENLKTNVLEAVNLTFDHVTPEYKISDLKFTYDLASFFNFYKVINAKALSERIGMNQSLLAQYINGIKKPSLAQTKKIMDGVHQIGKELSEIRLS